MTKMLVRWCKIRRFSGRVGKEWAGDVPVTDRPVIVAAMTMAKKQQQQRWCKIFCFGGCSRVRSAEIFW